MEMWIYAICGIILIIGIIICKEVWKEIHEFRVTEYEITSRKLDREEEPLKLVFLSDLHNHVYGEGNKDLLDAIRHAKPDYILIGGDMLVGRKQRYSYEKAVEFVMKLPKIAPTYYSNGNHEQRMHEMPEYYGESYYEYKNILEASGVIWLENDSVCLKWGKKNIKVSGVEIPMDCYRRPRMQWLQTTDLEERIGKSEKENYQILLAHHPEYAEVYKEWGADLTLSGHLHGGVARLPICGGVGVISPQAGLFPKYSGDCYDLKDGAKIIVSKGLGTHTFHIRFWNPAELILIKINGER